MNTQTVIPLEVSFEQNGQRLVQIKRNDKAALYRRETLEGTIVSYETFAVKSKNGKEAYPAAGALRKWLWNGLNLDKITETFNNITSGDICVWNCDPETNEVLPLENDPSLDELLEDMSDVTPTVETLVVETPVVVAEPVVETPVVVEPIAATPVTTENYVEVVNLDNPPVTEPIVETPVIVAEPVVTPINTVPVVVNNPVTVTSSPVTVNTDGSATVVVAKVKKTRVKKTDYVIPTGTFNQAQIARANVMPERGSIHGVIKSLIKQGKIAKVGNIGKAFIYSATNSSNVTSPSQSINVPVAAGVND